MITFDEKPPQIGTVIKIIGVGGAGGNAINNMIDNNLQGVEFIAANTDISDLHKSKAKMKLQLGKKLTRGLGTGANPDIGRQAAEESKDEIRSHVEGADMVFIAAGMGGGTGTGASPVIAKIAKELNILTLAIVNRPFLSEGKRRLENAEEGIKNLREFVDTIIVLPNEKLKDICSTMSVLQAFHTADNVLHEAAKAVSDIINLSGYINVDFADVRTVMQNMGYALMGTGVAEGEGRAVRAAQNAIHNPLLEGIELAGCQSLLINVTAGYDIQMPEFDAISEVITTATGSAGNIITGLIFDDSYSGKISVTIIATGLNGRDDEFPRFQITPKSTEQATAEIDKIFQTLNMQESFNNNELNLEKESFKLDTAPTALKTEIPSFLKALD